MYNIHGHSYKSCHRFTLICFVYGNLQSFAHGKIVGNGNIKDEPLKHPYTAWLLPGMEIGEWRWMLWWKKLLCDESSHDGSWCGWTVWWKGPLTPPNAPPGVMSSPNKLQPSSLLQHFWATNGFERIHRRPLWSLLQRGQAFVKCHPDVVHSTQGGIYFEMHVARRIFPMAVREDLP